MWVAWQMLWNWTVWSILDEAFKYDAYLYWHRCALATTSMSWILKFPESFLMNAVSNGADKRRKSEHWKCYHAIVHIKLWKIHNSYDNSMQARPHFQQIHRQNGISNRNTKINPDGCFKFCVNFMPMMLCYLCTCMQCAFVYIEVDLIRKLLY